MMKRSVAQPATLITKVGRRLSWLLYLRQVERRWREWERIGGHERYSQATTTPLLVRPSFNPLPLDDPIFTHPHYRPALRSHQRRRYEEFVYHIHGSCYIEPDFGYIIREPYTLIQESLAWSRFALTQETRHFFSGVPSLSHYLEARASKLPVHQESIVISLRHVFDENYGHCLIQLMPALQLLEDCGVPHDIPIVVSSALGKSPFFQDLIQRGRLRNRRWLVQDNHYIHAHEVIFARTEWPSPTMLTSFLDSIDAPAGNPDKKRRLFVLRRNRQISNMDALIPLVKSFGFEQVRPEEYSFARQMEMFSEAEFVCGVLGAALTNIIFRRNPPGHLLQICSSDETDLFYYALARTCGYSYRYLVGGPYQSKDRHSDFSVDPERFRSLLSEATGDV